jgi:hypothetical protein
MLQVQPHPTCGWVEAMRFMPDLSECFLDHIISDIALAYDAESSSRRARALSVHHHSLMQFCLRMPAEPIYSGYAAGGRKIVAPAHASARLAPNLSEEGVDAERRVDEKVGGAQLAVASADSVAIEWKTNA